MEHDRSSRGTGTTMMRSRRTGRLIWGVLFVAALGGCKQQLFLDPADYQDALKNGTLARLENQPQDAIKPSTLTPGAAPATIMDPSRPPRPLTLKEAIAIALEQGNVGGPATSNPGFANDSFSQFTGRGTSGTDTIRAFALDPAIAGAEVERSLSKFDARWINSISWNKVDQPTLTLQQSFSNGDTAAFTSTLAKPLPAGGVAGITFSTNYLSLAQPPNNPQFVALTTSYTPRVQFLFEQPLLQGFGVEINQLNGLHPGSLVSIPGLRASGGQGTEGILIARIRQDQQRAEFDRQVNTMLLNVETAYWNLFSAYYNLAAQEEGLKQSLDAYAFFRERAEKGTVRKQLMYQSEAQYELFRTQVVTARGQVLTAERQLRGVLGMRSDDGTRLVPIDEPTLVPYRPDYQEIANEALQYRPELIIGRQELKARQLDLVLQKNLRRPDLRFFSSYDVAGLGPKLDGSGINENAFASLGSNQFNSWTAGFRLDMPLGFRDANALVRQAQLNMRRTYYFLMDSERKTLEVVTDQYRRVLETNEIIRTRRAQRVALERFIELDQQIRNAGAFGVKEDAGSFINNLITSQRDLASATASEYRAVADYNIALANLEFVKGTIQRYDNVSVADGPLPAHVQKKAVDHFRARDVALKLREHPAELPLAPLAAFQPTSELPAFPEAVNGLPPAGGNGAAVPAAPPMKPWMENAPAPLPLNSGTPKDAELAPAPRTPEKAPMTPPAGSTPLPLPSAPTPGTGGPITQGADDGKPSFAPVGTLTLHKRPGAAPTVEPATPLPPPSSTPTKAVPPSPIPTGGLPTVAPPPVPSGDIPFAAPVSNR